MFIPLHDANKLRHVPFQYVTVGLIVLNALILFIDAWLVPGFTTEMPVVP